MLELEGKLLLATSCDGSMKTRAQYTTTCVVCNNTLRMATATDSESVELSHTGVFNAETIQEALELKPEAFLLWQKAAEQMAQYQLSSKQASAFFDLIFNGPIAADSLLPATFGQIEEQTAERTNRHIDKCIELFNGEMIGGNLGARHNTLWGAVNCVTEYTDHWRQTKTMDARIDRAWFGDGAKVKDRAWDEALRMAA